MSPEDIAQLDAIKVNMNEAGLNAINIVLAFVMFGVALGIKPRTFIDVFKNPKSVVLGIICQLFVNDFGKAVSQFFADQAISHGISPRIFCFQIE